MFFAERLGVILRTSTYTMYIGLNRSNWHFWRRGEIRRYQRDNLWAETNYYIKPTVRR